MKTRKLVPLASLVALVLALTALTAFTGVEAKAAGNIVDNTITSTTIDPNTKIATISGTLTCSTPTSLTVFGWARQSHGNSDRFAEYFGGTQLTCGTTPTSYEVTLTPGYESDKLTPGLASVGTWAEYWIPGGGGGLGADGEMRLRPAR